MDATQHLNELPKWGVLWQWLDQEEQKTAVSEFMTYAHSDQAPKGLERYILRELAKKLRFRPESIRRLPRQKLEIRLRQFFPSILDDRDWPIVFREYMLGQKTELLVRFLDLLGIAHDDQGVTHVEFALPNSEELRVAVDILVGEFNKSEVTVYFAVLLKQDEVWMPLHSHLERLISSDEMIAPSRGKEETTSEEKNDSASDDEGEASGFTTLDRVLVDQIVATTSGQEGALETDALADLVDSVVQLNASRHRSFFHLGFMETLIPELEPSFDRPEFNDNRIEWYLAGSLAAYSRRRDAGALTEVLKNRGEDFSRAAEKTGGAGAVLASIMFRPLVEIGRLSEAVLLLKGQLPALGLRLAVQALDLASDFLHENDIASSQSLLKPILAARGEIAGNTERLKYLFRAVQRRFGQCLQAQGDFPGARELFQRLLEQSDISASPDLLADMGLVAGGFKSLSELKIPIDPQQRSVMVAALKKGEKYYRQAEEENGVEAVNANYAIGLLLYLRATQKEEDIALRDEALNFVQITLAGIRGSRSPSAYERLGILGHALFLQAVLQMQRLDPVDAKAAMAAWGQITEDAGHFPKEDVNMLLQAADVIAPEDAVLIAESIWKNRRRDALEMLCDGQWVVNSNLLREELLSEARCEDVPQTMRWRLWSLLVPAFISKGENKLAEEGMDEMECLSMEPELGGEFLNWLGDRSHYDPVWDETDVLWARVRLNRLLGKDTEVANSLRTLFFLVRDQRPGESQKIFDVFVEYNFPNEQFSDLENFLPIAEEAILGIEEKLRQGDTASVLFVGGNEIQQQYDDDIVEMLRKEWPGVRINFRHTGWSSNWGREVDGLISEGNASDAVVIMKMIRTMLGRTLRCRLEKPWVACTGTGKKAMLESIREAVRVGVQQRG